MTCRLEGKSVCFIWGWTVPLSICNERWWKMTVTIYTVMSSTVTSQWNHQSLFGKMIMWKLPPMLSDHFTQLLQRWRNLEGIPLKLAGQGHGVDCSLRHPNSDGNCISTWKASLMPSLAPLLPPQRTVTMNTPSPPPPPISNDGWTNWCRMIGPFILAHNSGFHI